MYGADATLLGLFCRSDTLLLLAFMSVYNLKSSWYITTISDQLRELAAAGAFDDATAVAIADTFNVAFPLGAGLCGGGNVRSFVGVEFGATRELLLNADEADRRRRRRRRLGVRRAPRRWLRGVVVGVVVGRCVGAELVEERTQLDGRPPRRRRARLGVPRRDGARAEQGEGDAPRRAAATAAASERL